MFTFISFFFFLLSGVLKKPKNCLYLSKSLLRYTMRFWIKRLNGFLEIVKILLWKIDE